MISALKDRANKGQSKKGREQLKGRSPIAPAFNCPGLQAGGLKLRPQPISPAFRPGIKIRNFI